MISIEEAMGEDTDEAYTISKRTGKSETLCLIFYEDEYIRTIEVQNEIQ